MKNTIIISICCSVLFGLIGFQIGNEFRKDSQTTSNKITLSDIDKQITGMENELYKDLEYCYFEGQKDAIEGDLRIVKVGSCYQWTKSVWDDTKRPNTYIIPCKQ